MMRVFVLMQVCLCAAGGCAVQTGSDYSGGGFSVVTAQPAAPGNEQVVVLPSTRRAGAGNPRAGDTLAVAELGEPSLPRGVLDAVRKSAPRMKWIVTSGGPDVIEAGQRLSDGLHPLDAMEMERTDHEGPARRALHVAVDEARRRGASYVLVLTAIARTPAPGARRQRIHGLAGAVLIDVADGAVVKGWFAERSRGNRTLVPIGRTGERSCRQLTRELIADVARVAAKELAADAPPDR